MDPSVKSAVMSSAPDPPSAEGWPRLVVGRWLPSWAVSFVVHLVLICLLAFITIPPSVTETIVVSGVEEALPEPFEDEPVVEDQIEPSEEMTLEDAEPALESAPVELEDTVSTEFDDAALAAPSMEVVDLSHKFVPKVNWSKELGAIGGRGLEGRGAAARQRMVREAGGSAGSEAAVARGLAWLAGHQRPDGGWALDHRMAGCRGACTHPGDLDARIAATGLALLPFLGAGHTHQQGKYKAVVARGLDYLLRRQRTRGQVGDWRDAGNMYSHGIATIAVCEAYAMTRDPRLARPAQRALNFIVFAQDPVVGGWRYQPRQPGDTSVTGWQIMALKSGHMAYLIVPGTTVGKADRFLTAVQTRGGARYGYAGPGEAASTTAIGLLCRMYMGWQHDHEALRQGVAFLSKTGPNNNLYYDYYAAQVMRHYGGKPWRKWNAAMRDWLVGKQSKKGHAAGSWYIEGPHAHAGGRLYCTSLATMILEVYYRHMPLYEEAATKEGFDSAE